MPELDGLKAKLQASSGSDKAIDAAIAARFAVPPADYTASVEACRTLVGSVLTGWRLHIGWGVSGLFPYATLGNGETRAAAEAPTVPLAILRALLAAVEQTEPAKAP